MEPQKENRLPKVEVDSPKTGENFLDGKNNFDNIAEIKNKTIDKDKLFEDESMFGNLSDNSMPKVVVPIADDVTDNSSTSVAAISTPATAADGDLMEKEWINNLKQMIVETRDDPYLRQKKFKDMQVDYLKKRYDRIINEGK